MDLAKIHDSYTTPRGTISVFLRASDCIHLVTAIHHNFAAIFTHDKYQTVAAATLGLEAVAILA